jgi:copper(I)-binding protein
MRAFLFAMIAALAAGCGQTAQETPAEPAAPMSAESTLNVSDAWAAPTPGGVDVSAGYLTIANTGQAEDQLVAASSPRAARVEIHEMGDENGVMRMRQVTSLTILPGGEARLAPGGHHLMFFGVTQPFTEGEEIPVELRFQSGTVINVSLAVRRSGNDGGAHSGH